MRFFIDSTSRHPEWVSAADLDADLTVEPRRRLLERAVAVDALVLATHLPTGGKVERSDEAYRVPVFSVAFG